MAWRRRGWKWQPGGGELGDGTKEPDAPASTLTPVARVLQCRRGAPEARGLRHQLVLSGEGSPPGAAGAWKTKRRPAVVVSSALYPSTAARIVGHFTGRDWKETKLYSR